MARLTKKKTEAAQAAEVATETQETLAAEAAAEVAAEAVKATEESHWLKVQPSFGEIL